MVSDRKHRAGVHAALGEPNRLGIIEELASSDRSPSELGELFDLPTNLLAHHLDVLENAGLIERFASAGDRRRRYVRLVRGTLAQLGIEAERPTGSVLFVCTHNSARSQLAAALWRDRTGGSGSSAGTHPADAVHPGAVLAARRVGLDLDDATPRMLSPEVSADLIVTVCDRAHEELDTEPDWWHWSIDDPSEIGTRAAFDAVVSELDARITALQ